MYSKLYEHNIITLFPVPASSMCFDGIIEFKKLNYPRWNLSITSYINDNTLTLPPPTIIQGTVTMFKL